MATISIEQNVVVIRNPAKCKEIRNALTSNRRSFSEIKPTFSQPTKAQEEFIQKWFCHSTNN